MKILYVLTISFVFLYGHVTFGQQNLVSVFTGPETSEANFVLVAPPEDLQFSVQSQLGGAIIDRLTGRRDGATIIALNELREIAAVTDGDILRVDTALIRSRLDTRLSNFSIADIDYGSDLDQVRFSEYIQAKLRAAALSDVAGYAYGQLRDIEQQITQGSSSGERPLDQLNDYESRLNSYEAFYQEALTTGLNSVELNTGIFANITGAVTASGRPLLEALQTVGADGAAFLLTYATEPVADAIDDALDIIADVEDVAELVDFDNAPSNILFSELNNVQSTATSIYDSALSLLKERRFSANDIILLLPELLQLERELRELTEKINVSNNSSFFSSFSSFFNSDEKNALLAIESALQSILIARNYQDTIEEYSDYLSDADIRLSRVNQIDALALAGIDALTALSAFSSRINDSSLAAARLSVTTARAFLAGAVNVTALFSDEPAGSGSIIQTENFNDYIDEAVYVAFINSKYYERILDTIGVDTVRRYSGDQPDDLLLFTSGGRSSMIDVVLGDIILDLTGQNLNSSSQPLPGIVTGLRTTSLTNGVHLTWDSNPNADFYQVNICDDSACNNWSLISNVESSQFTDAPVRTFGERFYRVASCNSFNQCGLLSEPTLGSVATPSASAHLISFDIEDGSIYLENERFTENWRFLNDGSQSWDESVCMRHIAGVQLSQVGEFCVNGVVPPGESYTFSVDFIAPEAAALDQSFRDDWNLFQGNQRVSGGAGHIIIVVEGKPIAADVPNSFQAVGTSPTSITLTWLDSDSGSDYRIYRSLNSTGEFVFFRQLSSLSFIDDELIPGTPYFYRLERCVNGNDNDTCSGQTSIRTATTQAAAIPESLIQSNELSLTTFLSGSTVDFSTALFNGGGIALNDRFNFLYVLSDDSVFSSDDEILYSAAPINSSYVLNINEQEQVSFQYVVPDSVSNQNKFHMSCIIYNRLNVTEGMDNVDQVESFCESTPVIVVQNPLIVPNVPSQPLISYRQGAGQLIVNWNRLTGASFFRLERSVNSSTGFSEVFSGNGLSYLDLSIQDDNQYFYRLRSCQNSLIETCSSFTQPVSVSTLPTATNDFFVDGLEISRSGNEISLEVSSRYSGDSVEILRPRLSFYISSDLQCSDAQDILLGTVTSGLSVNDTVDTERLTVNYPNEATQGTFYACVITDVDEAIAESNESNNSVSIIAQTDVPAPNLSPVATGGNGAIEVNWSRVSGNVEYRLERLSNGSFTTVYLGTATSFTENFLPSCAEVSYRLLSCNGRGSSASCSASPVVSGFTLPRDSLAPQVVPISPTKIEVSWEEQQCAGFYVLSKQEGGRSSERIFTGEGSSHIDNNFFSANRSATYQLEYCASESLAAQSKGTFCASSSDTVTARTLSSDQPDDNWRVEVNGDSLQGRTSTRRIVFKNRVWSIGGVTRNESNNLVSHNDIWSSIDGVNFDKVLDEAPFSTRRSVILTVHNERIYMMSGQVDDLSNTSEQVWSREIWSTSDGINWVEETSSAPFPARNNQATFTSFNGFLYVIGGRSIRNGELSGELSDVWRSIDGKSWERVTDSAVFGRRARHQTIATGNQMLLLGGSGQGGVFSLYDDIWSTSDGESWELVRVNVPYGGRRQHSVIKFDQRYWLIGGDREVQEDAEPNSQLGVFEITRSSNPGENDVWVSNNGLDWALSDRVTPIPAGSALNATAFNNRILVGFPSGENQWSANYGVIVNEPSGELVLNGFPALSGELTADLSAIDFNFVESNLSYHWYRNNNLLIDEGDASLVLNDMVVGDSISLIVRYRTGSSEFFEFESAPVVVSPNPINVNFELEAVNVSLAGGQTTNLLRGLEQGFSVVYTSSNENVALVSGSGGDLVLTPLSPGDAVITANVFDGVTGARQEVFFTVTVRRPAEILSFGVSELAAFIDRDILSLELLEAGSGSGQITFTSNSPNVARIASSDGRAVTIDLIGLGEATIIATKEADGEFAESSTSITLTVSDNDFDNDGVSDDLDNCPSIANEDQNNLDNDFFGDVCDNDIDGDFIVNGADCAPLNEERFIVLNGFFDIDEDGFGSGSVLPVCSGFELAEQFASEAGDNCPQLNNPGQENHDLDQEGDVCDDNDDNDAEPDVSDCSELDASRWQFVDIFRDEDRDGIGFGVSLESCQGSEADPGFSFLNDDNCASVFNPSQDDGDGDGIGNLCELIDETCFPVKNRSNGISLICF